MHTLLLLLAYASARAPPRHAAPVPQARTEPAEPAVPEAHTRRPRARDNGSRTCWGVRVDAKRVRWRKPTRRAAAEVRQRLCLPPWS